MTMYVVIESQRIVSRMRISQMTSDLSVQSTTADVNINQHQGLYYA